MQQLTSDGSIYLQISQMIETDILRGVLLEEERAPSTNELARIYTINPATAAKGLGLLVEEGVLYKRRGVGMFVAPGAVGKIREKRRQAFFDKRLTALLTEADSLGISRAELIAHIQKEET